MATWQVTLRSCEMDFHKQLYTALPLPLPLPRFNVCTVLGTLRKSEGQFFYKQSAPSCPAIRESGGARAPPRAPWCRRLCSQYYVFRIVTAQENNARRSPIDTCIPIQCYTETKPGFALRENAGCAFSAFLHFPCSALHLI